MSKASSETIGVPITIFQPVRRPLRKKTGNVTQDNLKLTDDCDVLMTMGGCLTGSSVGVN